MKIRAQFCHSNEESANELVNDMEYLGFGRKSIIFSEKTSILGKTLMKKKKLLKKYTVSYYGRFPILLEALGVITGKRTIQDSVIPGFIMNGSKEIQRSFLSGIFGGDGSKIRFNKRMSNGAGQITLNRLSMSKDPEHIDSLKIFMQNIGNMLKKFDIETNYVHTFDGTFGKMCVHLGFEQKIKNIIKFYEEIGYKYDNLKNQESGLLVEYLKYKILMQNKFISTIAEIRNDIDNNMSYKDLMKKYNKTYREISHIKENYKNGIEIHERKNFKDYMNVIDFISQCKLENNTLFIPIYTIEDYDISITIADITVESKNHTFIANNFLVHNSPRNIYQSSMGKQAMGIYASNFNERFDTLAHILHYSQKPLVTTTFMKYMRFKELPAGINAIVAIACYGGYNQEDSIIVNKGALDRGIFRSTFFKTYVDQEKEIVRVGGLMEQFEVPNRNDTKGIQHGNYGKLANDGVIEPGSRVIENDIIIGKTTPIATSKQEISQMKKFKKRDVSTSMRQNEEGVIDKVLVTTNSDGFKYSKVKIRSIRIPVEGDKLACYSPDHDVLTDKGWIPITELNMEHKVASLVDGITLEYVYPTEVMSYDHQGKMYNIETNQVSLMVTPNHRMWVGDRNLKYKIKKAEDIYGKRSKYLKNCENYNANGINIPREVKLHNFRIFNSNDEVEFEFPLHSWLIMFGIWIAEGGCYYREDINEYYVHFSSNKIRVQEALNKIEEECNGIIKITKYTCRPDRGEYGNTAYRICNKKLAKYFHDLNLTGAINKDLPDWVWCLNQIDCRLLIDGMMLGDGHTMKNGTRRYDTSSIKLANSFQRLCLHAGYSTNIQLKYAAGKQSIIKKEGRNNEIITSNYDAWRMTIIKSQNNPLVNKNINAKDENRQDFYLEYHGKVYCCTVPSGIIYVRRNKIPVWSGNSRHGLTLQEK